MSKESIDNGNAINCADTMENLYMESAEIPSAYPDSNVYISRTIDGDSSTCVIYTTFYVDLKNVYKLKKLNIRMTRTFHVLSFKLYISESYTDDYASATFVEVPSTYSNYILSYKPVAAFNCRWYKITMTSPSEEEK